jgi:hypothetical protein
MQLRKIVCFGELYYCSRQIGSFSSTLMMMITTTMMMIIYEKESKIYKSHHKNASSYKHRNILNHTQAYGMITVKFNTILESAHLLVQLSKQYWYCLLYYCSLSLIVFNR